MGRLASASSLVLLAAGVTAAAVGACATATGEVSGGESRFDAAPPVTTAEPTAEAGATCVGQDGTGTEATWSAIYAEFFAPSAPASCAGDGKCHGSAAESGAKGSGGFICPDKDTCRTSMLGAPELVAAKDFTAPEKSYLVLTLRRCRAGTTQGGSMPKRPANYVFSLKAIDRIQTWIKNGAPND